MTTVPSLKNINFMSENRFNSLDNLSEEELYVVNIGSVLTTNSMKKSETGFVKFSNGIIIQWGVSTSETFTFPTAFSSANSYQVTVTVGHGSRIAAQEAVVSKSSTSATIGLYQAVNRIHWIAVGY